MKKIFLILYLLAAGIASAKTSYTIEAEQYRRDDMVTERVNFCLSEIAAAAGYTSSSAMQEAMQSKNIFWGNDTIGGGELTNDYTYAFCRGFYLSADGCVVPHYNNNKNPSKSYFFCYFRADAAKNKLVCHIGQMRGKCRESDMFRTSVYLINKADTVEFNILFSIKKEIEIPNPTLNLSALNIVGETELHIDASAYFSGSINMEIDDIAEKLGVEDISFPQMLDRMLYAKTYDITTEKITNALTGYVGSKELGFKIDDFNEDPVCPCAALESAYYSDCFTIKGLNYEKESGMLTAAVIVNDELTKVGDKFETQLYLIYTNCAFKINLFVRIAKNETPKIENLEYVGKSALRLEKSTAESAYKEFDFDINLIKEELNCNDSSAIKLLLLDDKGCINGDFNLQNENHIYRYDITTRGTWCDKKFENENDYGFSIVFYPAITIQYPISIFTTKSKIIIKHSKAIEAGDSIVYKTPLLFVYCNKVYEIELITTFKSHYVKFNDGEEVGSENIYAQLPKSPIRDNFYGADVYAGYSKAVELTGSDSLQTFVYKSIEKEQDKGMMTNQGNFYMTSEGYRIPLDSVSVYTGNDKEYLEINPHINYFNKEDFSKNFFRLFLRNSVGNIYTGSVFLVNMKNKKYYTINYVVEPVDEVRYMEYVGEENILLVADNISVRHTEFDISKAAEALGIQGEWLLTETEWQANKSNKATVLYTNAGYSDAHSGFSFDTEGCMTKKEENTAFYVGYVNENGKHCFATSAVKPLEEGEEYTTRLALDYGNKRYVYRIRLVDEQTYTAIGGVNAEKPQGDGVIYDLSGRIVGSIKGLPKDIYIRNGKKFVVK